MGIREDQLLAAAASPLRVSLGSRRKTRSPLIIACVLFAALLAPFATPTRAADESSAFGSTKKNSAALIGIFYDLKQNQKREPVAADYMRTLGQFLDSGWDESVLSRFFRGVKPIYATEVFIPNMGAGGAPKAFAVEKVVRPSQFFVIYKGQVSPPEDGTYRFVGIADDVMAVGVNGKTVLVSHFGGWKNYSKWVHQFPQENIKSQPGTLRRGDWFDCKMDQIIDLDILIGEYPGTAFGAWLLIEKKGVTYPVINNPTYGPQTILPAFRVSEKLVTTQSKDVPFSNEGKPWICHQ